MTGGAALDLVGVTRRFSGTSGVWPCDLAIAAGEFFCLLGPSGSGKTTLLRLIGGYLAPDAGTIRLGGADITAVSLERRRIGMVFQNFALFPHLSAAANVAFGLEARRTPQALIKDRVAAMLTLVGLPAPRWGAKPAALSGGEQQRVALARALVLEPALLLLDEPLSSLDRMLRQDLRTELRALQQRTGVAALMVTHDPDDALTVADRIGIMRAGSLVQVGTPETLYERPDHAFVARLMGDANILTVTGVDEAGPSLLAGWRVPVRVRGDLKVGDGVLIRPEWLCLADGPAPDAVCAVVRSVRHGGPDQQIFLDPIPDGMSEPAAPPPPLHLRRRGGGANVAVGDRVFVRCDRPVQAIAVDRPL